MQLVDTALDLRGAQIELFGDIWRRHGKPRPACRGGAQDGEVKVVEVDFGRSVDAVIVMPRHEFPQPAHDTCFQATGNLLAPIPGRVSNSNEVT